MKKLFTALLFPLMLASGITHGLPIISVSNIGEVTTSVAGATIIDFNTGCGYTSCTGDFALVNGNESGKYAQPLGVNSPFLSVPNPSPVTQSAMFNLGVAADYFGLFWGSIDSYNFVNFYLDNNLVASYSGSDIVGQFADGNQLSYNANRYINFDFADGFYDSVKLTSNGFAFESDNHAFRKWVAVTEPAMALLLLIGLVGLALARRNLRIAYSK